MQLNIKDAETHRMVTRLSQVTGVSRASAVKEAVRRRLEEIEQAGAADREKRIEKVLELAAQIRAQLPTPPPTRQELDDWMYGDDGLPH